MSQLLSPTLIHHESYSKSIFLDNRVYYLPGSNIGELYSSCLGEINLLRYKNFMSSNGKKWESVLEVLGKGRARI